MYYISHAKLEVSNISICASLLKLKLPIFIFDLRY